MLIVWLYVAISFGFWLAFMALDRETEKDDPKIHLVIFFLWWFVAYVELFDKGDGPHA